jgi:hypothetical protein
MSKRKRAGRPDWEELSATLEEIRQVTGTAAEDLFPRNNEEKTDLELLYKAQDRLSYVRAVGKVASGKRTSGLVRGDAPSVPASAETSSRTVLLAQYEQLMRDSKSVEASALFDANEAELFAAAEARGDKPNPSIQAARPATTATAATTVANGPHALLLQYEALAAVPVAQGMFFEAHETELAEAAEQMGDAPLNFTEAEIANALAGAVANARQLVAEQQAAEGARARIAFLNQHEAELTAALAIIEKLC